MGVYGTNLEGFGAFEGGVNADKGAPLVSTSSDGETALLFGPAALREIQAGVANGDFAIPPDAAGDTITDENPLPYWTFTDVNSAGAITAAIVADAGAGSGNVLRFTVASGTLTGKSATLTRYIPVASSASRSFSFYAEATFDGGTNSTQANAKLTCQFYKADQTTTTGTAFESDLYTFNLLQTPTGVTAPDLYVGNVDLVNTTAPADAAFAKLTITIATAGVPVETVQRTSTTATITTLFAHGFTGGQSVTVSLSSGPTGFAALNGTFTITGVTSTTFTYTTATSGTITLGNAVGTASVPVATDRIVDLTEVRLGSGLPELILTDKSLPTNPPAYIIHNNEQLILSSGNQFAELILDADTYLTSAQLIEIIAPDIVLNGNNSNWVSRITATAAQSLTNNTLTKITFNTASSTPGLDSYDPQGWFDNANDRIVIGQDGFYNITANVGFASNATSRRLVQIFVNGSDRGSVQVTASAAGSTLLSVSTNIYLVATDYVEVHALQQSGGALNTASVTGVYPVLSVARLGA